MHEFQQVLYCCNYDIIFVTETWFHSEVDSGLLDPKSDYYILRKDRIGPHHGGGIAAFISRSFTVCNVPIDSRFINLELLCFDLLFSTTTVRFFVVYRPPNGGGDTVALDNMHLLIACFKEYSVAVETSIIVGDFNLPKVNWQMSSCHGDGVSKQFLNFVTTRGYYQFVSFPTREDNILDLIFANDEQIINSVLPRPPLGHSDHCIIDFNVVVKCVKSSETLDNTTEINRKLYNWYSSDFESMIWHLDCVDWNSFICYHPQAACAWSKFVDVLWTLIDAFVPTRSCKVRQRKCYPKDIRKLICKKRQLWKKHRTCPSDLKTRWDYRECANKLRAKCREMVLQEEQEVVCSRNLGSFYRYINKRRSHRDAVGVLVDDSGGIVTSNKDKANVLNAYYASVSVIDNGYMPVCHSPTFKTTVETVVFSERGVVAAINKLKPNLSSGPDNIPPLFFKKVKYSISKPLALLFNQFLSVGFVPEAWKNAIITPVYKHGPAEMPKNYRPISLTSVAGKLMERGIANTLYEHLSCNGLLSSVQHGFVKGKSTCTNLLECVNDWTLILQDKSCVTVAYVDFSKAFDTVSHAKLFARLRGLC